MQLIIINILIIFFIFIHEAKSQISKLGNDSTNSKKNSVKLEQHLEVYQKPEWKTVDIDFLSSYYEQDGNNSPVTGGIGTEFLTDFTQKILVNIPMSKKLSLKLDAGYDYYSSVSTDNIDNIRSSDSSSDMRTHGNIGVQYKLSDWQEIGGRIGASAEYDYFSAQGGLNYSISSRDNNTNFGVSTQAFIDKWVLYYPKELRGKGRLVETDKRQSYNLALSLSQVISKKTQVSFMLEGTHMNGLLSTPFHRVYFKEQQSAKVEILPSKRTKIPVGLRLNQYISEQLIARLYYRYYWDDWGIKAHTLSLDLPIKINRFFWISPSLRYHTQTGSQYFLPFKEHSIVNEFYSSDFDLAELNSITYGLAIGYQPASGLAKVKIPFTKNHNIVVKSIDLKMSHYRRSNDLNASIISLGIGFQL